MRSKVVSLKTLVLLTLLSALLGPPAKVQAVTPYTAPSGDLTGDAEVNVADLQCEVLVFEATVHNIACATDDECSELGPYFGCRAGFSQDICLPYCLSQAVSLGESATVSCTDPGADNSVCLGLVQKRNADLNCDGSINNVDFLFMVQIIMEKLGGPDTADIDNDGRLNYCDDDSDGDGDPDSSDCSVLDPGVNSLFDEVCDGVDNDCNSQIDAADPGLVLQPCANQEGVCQGSEKPAQLCAAGQWASCTTQHYSAHSAAYETAETLCDGLDNDCDAAIDAADSALPHPACEMQSGVCQGALKTDNLCLSSGWAVCGTPAYLAHNAAFQAIEARCDGLDNDCNGQADEPWPDLGQPCDGPDSDMCKYGILACAGDGLSAVCGTETLQDLPEICQNELDDDCDGEVDEHSLQEPCEPYRPPVTSAVVQFLATRGVPAGTTEPGPGQYESTVWNHTDISTSTSVQARCLHTTSASKSSSAVAGEAATVELWAGRPDSYADDTAVPLLVFVTDENSMPVSGLAPVTVNMDGPAGAAMVSLGGGAGGMYTGTYNPEPLSYVLGGSISMVATAGGKTSASTNSNAVQSPTPATLALGAGQTGFQLPLGDRLPDVQFAVPIKVHAGGQTMASVQMLIDYPQDLVDYLGVTVTNGGINPFAISHDAGLGQLNIATTRNVQTDPALLTGEVQLATVNFRIKTAASKGQSGDLAAQVLEFLDVSGNNLSVQADAEIHDGSGQGASGTMYADGVQTRGLVAHSDDLILADLSAAGLGKDAGALHVYRFRNDSATPQATTGYACGCAPACQCAGNTVVPDGTDLSTLQISQDGFARALTVLPWTVTDVQLLLDDPVLNQVDGWTAGFQATRYTVQATVSGPDAATQVLDITPLTDVQTGNPAIAAWDDQHFQIQGMSAGSTLVSAVSAGGQTIASQTVSVSDDAVVVTAVTPVIPSLVEMLSIQPNPTPAFPGTTAARARVSSLFLEEGQAQAWHVTMETDDGATFDATAATGLTVTSQSGGAIAAIEGADVVARGSGSDIVEVQWAPLGPVVAVGQADVEVVLPDPTSATFSPESSKLALNAADAAAVVKGLPTTRDLQVVIEYDNGSSKNMTNDTRTLFEVTSGATLVKVCNHDDNTPGCATGRVISLDAGTGTATVKASWPGLYTEQVFAQATVEVVAHGTLTLTTWEDYDPVVTPETVLSTFEGTSVYQKARLKLEQTYTDGSTSVVTDHAQTSYSITDQGGEPSADVVQVQSYKLIALFPGTAFVTASLLGNESNSVEMMVEGGAVNDGDGKTHADIINMELVQPGDLVGVKDTAQRKVTVNATFDDGARANVVNNGSVTIPGLVQFTAGNAQYTNPADSPYVTIDSVTGTSTLRGNGLTRIVTTISPGMDLVPVYNPGPPPQITQPNPLVLPAGHAPTKWLKCNLTAQAGDGDLGAASGLAVPLVVDPGQYVSVDIWLNSGSAKLGAFSLEVNFDTVTFEIPQPSSQYLTIHIPTDASAINDPTPGTVKVTAVPSAGSNLTGTTKVATMTLRATNNKQGLPVYSQLSGTILEMYESCPDASCPAIEGVMGPAPRAFVAGLTSIDPVGNLAWKGDFNDDGAFGVADLQTILNYVVAPASPQFAGLDLESANIFPDRTGEDLPQVQAFDAYYGALISVGLSHFVDVTHTVDAVDGFAMQITVRDGSAQPQLVTSNLRVSVEVGLESGLAVADHIACGVKCELSHDADLNAVPERVIFQTTHNGQGVYTLSIPDFASLPGPDTAQLVVVLQNLNADGSNKGDPKVYLRTPLENPDSPFDPLLAIPVCDTHLDCDAGKACIAGACADQVADGANCTSDGDCQPQLHCGPVTGVCEPDKAVGEECIQDSQCAAGLGCVEQMCADTLCKLSGSTGETADCQVHLVREDQAFDPAVGIEYELHYSESLMTLDKVITCGAFPPPAGLPCTPGDGTCEAFGSPDIFCSESAGTCWFCQDHDPAATDITLANGHSVNTCAKPPTNCKPDRFKVLIYSAESAPVNDAWLDNETIAGGSNFMTFRFLLNADVTGEPVSIYPLDFFATDASADYLEFAVGHTPASGVDHYMMTGITLPD